MTRSMWAIVLLILAVALTAQGEEPVFDVPRLDDITIDGDVSDWGERGFYVGLLADETRQFKAASDFDGRLWLGWDDKGLLIRAEGRDDQYVEHPEDWSIWAMDAVEMFMAVEPGSKDRYQICVAPGHTEEQPELRIQYYEFRDTEALRQIEMTGDAAATREGDTYFLEVRMPWSNLALTPKEGMSVGFQIYLNDQDPDDPTYLPRYTAMWYPGGQSNWYPDRMYRVRLAQEPSPPVLSMATVQTFTEVPLAWVEVNAVAELEGRQLALSGAALHEPAIVDFVTHEGRAVARVYVTTQAQDADPEGITLAVADEPVLNVAADTRHAPEVAFDASHEGNRYTFTPRLAPHGAFPAPEKADITLYDGQGTKVQTFEAAPGETFSVELERGTWLLTGTYPDTFGIPISGATGIVAGYPEEAQARLADLGKLVEEVQARVESKVVQDYQGYWLYRLETLEENLEKPEVFAEQEKDLASWLIQPQVNPNVLYERRGVFEWAYRSDADGSGQPFTVWIPYDYDESPIPAALWLHGAGGGHQEVKELPGVLGLSVLARGKTQGYDGLAGVDTLDAFEYVRGHWNIDSDRVTVAGGSMGGFGTFEIASRRPDLFAGAAPGMGGTGLPVHNLINVPVYATHGERDDIVAAGLSYAATEALQRAGGMAVLEIVPNYAHGLSEESIERAQQWQIQQERNASPSRIKYSALDGSATGAYGVHVVEWGAEWRPATFEAVRDGSRLYLTLDNVRTLELTLPDVIQVSINRGPWLDVPQYDQTFYVTVDGEASVHATVPDQPEIPFHVPGGAYSLYEGDPILVVWGTQADAPTNAAMLDVAERLRRTARPIVPEDPKGAESGFMAYGKLYGKPDTEVTDEDLRCHHVILVGTAAQNSVAARIVPEFPLTLKDGVLQASDGVSWPVEGRGWAFTYYNASAPNKRVLWLASEDPAFYAPRLTALEAFVYSLAIPDLVIADATELEITASRCFNAQWQWTPTASAYQESPLVPEEYCTRDGFGQLIARVIMDATGADASLTEVLGDSPDETAQDYRTGLTAGQTRLADLLGLAYYAPLAQITLSADELGQLTEQLPEFHDAENAAVLTIAKNSEEPLETYRLVADPWRISTILTRIFDWNDRLAYTGTTLQDALRESLAKVAAGK